MMALALAERGERAEALSLLEGVIDHSGDSPLVDHAKKLLREIDSPEEQHGARGRQVTTPHQ
jgi:hypothetical protein